MSDLYGRQYLSEDQEDFLEDINDAEWDKLCNESADEASERERDYNGDKNIPETADELRERMNDPRNTCFDCGDNDNCEFAFDPYNTNGDCLAIK